MKYQYKYVCRDDVAFEEGTQQVVAVMQHLNDLGSWGWLLVSCEGDLEDEFQIIMAQEVPNG